MVGFEVEQPCRDLHSATTGAWEAWCHLAGLWYVLGCQEHNSSVMMYWGPHGWARHRVTKLSREHHHSLYSKTAGTGWKHQCECVCVCGRAGMHQGRSALCVIPQNAFKTLYLVLNICLILFNFDVLQIQCLDTNTCYNITLLTTPPQILQVLVWIVESLLRTATRFHRHLQILRGQARVT